MRRVDYRQCRVKVEAVPWGCGSSPVRACSQPVVPKDCLDDLGLHDKPLALPCINGSVQGIEMPAQ